MDMKSSLGKVMVKVQLGKGHGQGPAWGRSWSKSRLRMVTVRSSLGMALCTLGPSDVEAWGMG